MTVEEFKKKVEDVTKVPPDAQRLIYGGKQLEDKKCLGDYPTMGNGSTVFLVLRLLGGANSTRRIDPSLPRSSEPCMITYMENELDFPVLKMPCGHSISPDGLMDYCWNEIGLGKYEIRCCLCKNEWLMEVIRKYGGATKVELEQLEVGLSNNFCSKSDKIQQCPGCNSLCERQDPSKTCTKCVVCSKKSAYHFCWNCLKPWKTDIHASTCGNDLCGDIERKLQILSQSQMVEVGYIKGLKTYKTRACIRCGTLIEHGGQCKHMMCTMCKQDFCFVCLQPRVNGSWICGSYRTKCEPAPIQKSIPRSQ